MAKLEEYQQIEIAIELDKRRSIESIAKQFGVSVHAIRKIAINAGLISPKKKKSRLSLTVEEEDRAIALVLEGEEFTAIAFDFDISAASLRQLCKRRNIPIPRSKYQLTKTECSEIRELLTANEPIEEIARAYNIAIASIDALREGYRDLNAEALGFLYETLLNHPNGTIPFIKKLAKKEGFEMEESTILSYQDRLKKLQLI
ncbi:MAG: hypothetical protein HQM14_09655 [SAR324 cluster bacterium]|nr:hypothetical protein [SAR324 cluster bacterium]